MLYRLRFDEFVGGILKRCGYDTSASPKFVAATNGNVAAHDLREEISMNMSHEDITEAQRLARQWVEAHY